MKKLFNTILLLSTLFAMEIHGEEPTIIKVLRTYGIISNGARQGVSEGQIYYVKRESESGLVEVGQVRVIRVTPNRAAVEQISNSNIPFLRIGDKLFAVNDKKPATSQYTKSFQKMSAPVSRSRPNEQTNYKKTKVISSTKKKESPLKKTADYSIRDHGLKAPWVSLNLGAGVPLGDLVLAYSPSFRIGASYMVTAARNIYLGLEINNTWLNNSSSLANANLLESVDTSASLLEALVTLQRFIGNNFFIEFGGGMYRPKIRNTSLDGTISTYSSTNFGLFGGTGFFMPTSEYAGFTLKGRFHTYFDSKSRQYYGITGGFRFRIK
ncbi:MAG: hypothetical protein ACE5IW_04415 [bacterium]